MFSIYGFADDHQLAKSFVPLLEIHALDGDINRCFNIISRWMYDFFLCLNRSKTKIIVVAPPAVKESIVMKGTFIGNDCIRFVTSAKNLGVILDDELSFEAQITSVVKACFSTIRKLSKIKSFLSYEHLRTLISACIFSKLDYCNSLYYGINQRLIKKLQVVQNSAVQLIKNKGNQQHLSTESYLSKFHWLPVKERIIFKLMLLVHKCLHGNAPVSLSNLLNYSCSARTKKLNHQRNKGIFGSRAFSRSSPKLWNLLPVNIRTEKNTDKFKVLLKTYLFKESKNFLQKVKEQ